MTKNIQIEIRNVYGNPTAYPINETGKQLAAMANQKTLTRGRLHSLICIGFDIEVVALGKICHTFPAGETANLSTVGL